MDTVHQRVANIEVASFNRSVVSEIAAGDPAFFHTNQYQTLLLRQPMSPSSFHRLRRYRHLTPPRSVQAVLNVLGDQVFIYFNLCRDRTRALVSGRHIVPDFSRCDVPRGRRTLQLDAFNRHF